jgi:tetratricopeptide (TPR) repeat protein
MNNAMTHSKKLPVVLSLFLGLGQTAVAEKTISQQTTGDCSPAIIAQGNVSFNCDISTKALKRLQKEVNNQATKTALHEVKLETLVKEFQEFKEILSKRDDEIAKQAQAKLDDGDFEGAEALFKLSFKQHAEDVENQQKTQAADAFALAKIKVLQLNYPEAKSYYQQAVQLDPENALYLNMLGLHLVTLGEYAEAEPLYLRSLAIREKVLGKDHPDVAASLNNLAELYRTQGKYDQAEPLYSRSLAIFEKALGKDHPDVAISLNNLAALYDRQGKYVQAEPLYLRSLAIWEKA